MCFAKNFKNQCVCLSLLNQTNSTFRGPKFLFLMMVLKRPEIDLFPLTVISPNDKIL